MVHRLHLRRTHLKLHPTLYKKISAQIVNQRVFSPYFLVHIQNQIVCLFVVFIKLNYIRTHNSIAMDCCTYKTPCKCTMQHNNNPMRHKQPNYKVKRRPCKIFVHISTTKRIANRNCRT